MGPPEDAWPDTPLEEHLSPRASLPSLLRLPTTGDTKDSLGSGTNSQEASHGETYFLYLKFCASSNVGTFPTL